MEKFATSIPEDVKRKIKKFVQTKIGTKKDNNANIDHSSLLSTNNESLEEDY